MENSSSDVFINYKLRLQYLREIASLEKAQLRLPLIFLYICLQNRVAVFGGNFRDIYVKNKDAISRLIANLRSCEICPTKISLLGILSL